jgi:hydroxymethylpyrimidine pyrophosphatase-like HAD family hydrolase
LLRSGSDSYDGVVDRVPDRVWVKSNIVCGCDRAEMERLRSELEREFPELDYVFPGATAPYIDLLPKGYSKGSAVRILADRLDIAIDEVAIFGDSENDLSMLEGFPNSVAVANASDVVKKAAAYHIGPVTEDSVAQMFEHICATGTLV